MASRKALKMPNYFLLFFREQNVTGIYSKNVITWENDNVVPSVVEKGVSCVGEVIAQNGNFYLSITSFISNCNAKY